MGVKLGELTEYFDPRLTLTVLGREYTLPVPSAELGLWLEQLVELRGLRDDATDEELQEAAEAAERLPDLPGPPVSFTRRLLGDAMDQMVADSVPQPYIRFCAQTAVFHIVGGDELAARWWQSGGNLEKVVGPGNRAARRAAARSGGTSTAKASSTPSPASTSGTTSPTKRSRGRGSRSRGSKS
jgi:hypothetical protein